MSQHFFESFAAETSPRRRFWGIASYKLAFDRNVVFRYDHSLHNLPVEFAQSGSDVLRYVVIRGCKPSTPWPVREWARAECESGSAGPCAAAVWGKWCRLFFARYFCNDRCCMRGRPKPRKFPYMKEVPKKRFSVGRRVLKGLGSQPATVTSVAEVPGAMGEYMHEIVLDAYPDLPQQVMGCELRPMPPLDADLRGGKQPAVHIHNSNVAKAARSSLDKTTVSVARTEAPPSPP